LGRWTTLATRGWFLGRRELLVIDPALTRSIGRLGVLDIPRPWGRIDVELA
jgi:hypothetical protein